MPRQIVRTCIQSSRLLFTLTTIAAGFLAFSSCVAGNHAVTPPPPQPAPATTLPAALLPPVPQRVLDDKALEKYRTMSIDSRVKSLPRDIVQNASMDPGRNLSTLVTRLVGAESDPFMKVKLIHDWIADNISYDYKMFAEGRAVDQTVESVLATRKAVCSGYSRLFQRMAELAGIKSEIVSGYAKGLTTSYSLDQRNSHSWNMVEIAGGKYLVDTTWDSGSIDQGYFVKEYSTDYLFISPRANLYSHFPKDPANQLVAQPIDSAVFLREPCLQGGFFRYGLSLATPGLSSRTKTSGSFALDIRSERPDVQIDASLKDTHGRDIDSATFVTRTGPDTWRVIFAIPSKGTFKGVVFAGPGRNAGAQKSGENQSASSATQAGKNPRMLESVMSLDFENIVPYTVEKAFPHIYASYNESFGEELVAPIEGKLAAGKTTHFEYHSKTAKNVALIADKTFTALRSAGNGLFMLDFTVPHVQSLKLAISDDGKEYWITISWEVDQ
jgi:hypothetical protein